MPDTSKESTQGYEDVVKEAERQEKDDRDLKESNQ